MGSVVTNVYVKFNYNRLHIDKALGNWKSDNNKNKNKRNVRSVWEPFPGPKMPLSDKQSSSIRIIRIIFLESYARILTYETLSYVSRIVAWYFPPVQGSSSLDFKNFYTKPEQFC